MAYVFDTNGDIMNYLHTLPGIKDTAQRETEFKVFLMNTKRQSEATMICQKFQTMRLK